MTLFPDFRTTILFFDVLFVYLKLVAGRLFDM